LGLDYEKILVIENKLQESYEVFFKNIESNVNIKSASASSQSPHLVTSAAGTYFKENEEDIFQLKRLYIDDKFLATMGIELKSGRNFNREIASDRQAIILNEEASKALGLEDPFSRNLMIGDKEYRIVGVTKDFHFESMHEKIKPLMMLLLDNGNNPNVLEVRFRGENVSHVVSFLNEQWKLVSNDVPFNYSFLADNIHALYRNERQLGSLFSTFAGLAILLACLGLFALAAHTTNHRAKEIGIRKVMGASMLDIFIMLSNGFIVKVLVAFAIAIPISYLVMQRWLENFAYRVEIKLWMFLMPGLIVVLIAWLNISYQIIKASRSNPVDALIHE
jgi:putative ABC transport system permease protein